MTWPEQIVIGERYERLTILGRVPREQARTRARWYVARCDCGTVVEVAGPLVARGDTRSCGCKRRETAAESCRSRGTHGHWVNGRPSRTYHSWQSMLTRCTNPKAIGWEYYGGRGITVCDRWRTFENFLEDMGERPAERTLDRIDPNGNYEPGNCRWATILEQRHNRRSERDLSTP